MCGWVGTNWVCVRVGEGMAWMDVESPRFVIWCVNHFEIIY